MRKLNLLWMLLLTVIFVVGCSGGDSESTGEEEQGNDSTETADTETESVELIAYSKWPDENHHSEGLKIFAEKIEEATDGRLIIDVKTGGALGYEGPEILNAVRDNLVPIADTFISDSEGDEKLFGIATLPFIAETEEEAELFFHEIARPYFDEVLENDWNQMILYQAYWPFNSLWTKEKLESIDDVKGLKVRTSNKMAANIVSYFGATGNTMPFSEVYSSLSTGLIDSVMTSSPSAVDGKFWEVLGHFSPANINSGHDVVTMNLDEFNKLDSDLQEAIIEVGAEMDEVMYELSFAAGDEGLEEVQAEGIEVTEPSEEFMEDLRQATEELKEEWLEDAPPEAHEMLDEFFERVGR